MKTYSEMIKLKTFEERFNYLKLDGSVADETFGSNRYLNQALYRSPDWKSVRRQLLIRDNGCDLAVEDREIPPAVNVLIHHINPITLQDILDRNPMVFSLENLVTTTKATHDGIHYGSLKTAVKDYKERTPNDTCPWKR